MMMKRRRLLAGVGAALGVPSAWAQSGLLRIGFQKSAVNLVVLKQQGTLEKRFPSTRVQWVDFPADPQRVADAFPGLGLIPEPVRVADIVWTPAKLARS